MSFPMLLALLLVNANVDAANIEDVLSAYACYDPAGMSCTCTGSINAYSDHTGTIPAALSACTGATSLILSGNAYSGTIPPELSTLTSLTTLWLQENFLTGTAPPELSTLTSMGSMCVIRPFFPCSLSVNHTPHSGRFDRSLSLSLALG